MSTTFADQPKTGARFAASQRHALALAAVLALLAPAGLAGSARAAQDDADSLAMSSGVPWNPPQPLARRMAWERGVLMPGRIVSLPFAGLGYGVDRLFVLMEQHPRLAIGASHPLGSGRRSLAFGTARMGGPSGLGGSVTVRRDLFARGFKSRVSAEYAATHHLYNRSTLTWTGRPMSLQYGYEWRPEDRFYGIGNRTSEDSITNYAGQREYLRAGVTWASSGRGSPVRIRRAFGVWAGPRSQVLRTGRQGGAVSYQARFPALGDATLDRRVDHLVYGASLRLDRRTGAPHWSHGWRTLVSAERFDAPLRALALHSAAERGARFTRYQAEAEGGLSFMRDPRTVRLLVRAVHQQVGANRDRMLIDDLSILGGSPGLGGYPSGRFHDLDLLLTRATYVFPLSRRLEMDLHSEWGSVYPDLAKHVDLAALRNSFGFALRVRGDRAPNSSVGLDFSREAVRFRFSFGGVE